MHFSRTFWTSVVCSFFAVPLILFGMYFQHEILQTLMVLKAELGIHSDHTVVLTEYGFEPEELVINVGEKVLFSTTRNEAFWPASNMHPQHTIFPDFDPGRPIAAKEKWVFTFTKAGSWKYHDHIFANYTGKIIVKNDDGTIPAHYPTTLDITVCSKVTESSAKRQCWDTQLEQAMKEGGVDGAFAYFSALYKTEPEVPKECHGWSHTLGKAGYLFYKEHGTIDLNAEASACGFGFYHAFLGELMKDTGNVMAARAFCENATSLLPDVETSCKHGVGHGASSMFSENPEYYSDFQKTANAATAVCEKIYTISADLTECYDGVFNEIYGNIFNSGYGYNYSAYRSAGKPFWQCHLQLEKYKEPCYINVVGMFWEMFNKDVVAGMTYALQDLQNLEQYGPRIVAKIAADRIQESIVAPYHQDSIQACAIVPLYLFDDCFGGILNGFIQHGDPNNLHQKGIAFCGELDAAHPKSKTCVSDFMSTLHMKYSAEHLTQVCLEEPLLKETETCIQALTENS